MVCRGENFWSLSNNGVLVILFPRTSWKKLNAVMWLATVYTFKSAVCGALS